MRSLCHHWVMDWHRLAQAIVDRRVELGHRTRGAFVRESGISLRVVADLETAGRANYDPVTIARLEKALEWPAGRARAILRGTEVDASTLPQVVQDIAHLLTPGTGLTDTDRALLRQGLESLVQLALNLAAMGGTPDFGDAVEPRAVSEDERVEAPRVRRV